MALTGKMLMLLKTKLRQPNNLNLSGKTVSYMFQLQKKKSMIVLFLGMRLRKRKMIVPGVVNLLFQDTGIVVHLFSK